MLIDSLNTIKRLNSNFFGNEIQLNEELETAVIKKSDDSGICWVNLINGIYYLRYCLDDLELLNKFIVEDVADFNRDYPMLLELKLNEHSLEKIRDLLFNNLFKAGFLKQSHHVSYIKNYFKKSGDSASVIRLNKDHLEDVCNLLPKINADRLSLTNELLHAIFENSDYLILAYYEGSQILGYIILHSGGNLENIGFIRDVYVDSDLDGIKRLFVGSSIFNSALNMFADFGFDRAVFWNDKANTDTQELLEKYGFKYYGSEVVAFARNSLLI